MFPSLSPRFVIPLCLGAALLPARHEVANVAPADRAPAAPAGAAKVVPHPLDPLTEEEFAAALQVLRDAGRASVKAFFPTFVLKEPPKDEVLAYKAGGDFRREAFVVVFERDKNKTAEAVVDLRGKKVVSWREVPGVQPTVLVEEYDSAGQLVREDPRWQKAMRDRGVADFEKVQLETWAAGRVELPGQKGARLLRVLSFLRGDATNAYARPVEGVLALVNISTGKVVEVIDRRPAVPIPAENDFFDPKTIGRARPPLPPLRVEQPEGRGFTVLGHEVQWDNWSFRFSLHPREGVVLHTVSWRDGEQTRPVLYRASLSEMVVPYGDPEEGTWNWRAAFDEGEYGLGAQMTVLRRGLEVPENAVLLSAPLAGDAGKPEVKKDVMALYERDGGLLWTHTDYKTNKTASRRARQLVLHSVFTVGNYDYGTQWVFHQDGVIEAQVELTGVMLGKGVAAEKCALCKDGPDAEGRSVPAGADRFGEVVARHVVAANHQHFFCFRLDLDVDGTKNSVQEMNVRPTEPAAGQPGRNGFLVERQLLRTELEAQRDLNFASQRAWKVFNPNRTTALGHFPGYLLQPAANSPPMAHAETSVRQRAGFLTHPLWVTRHRPGELYAAGDYVNQSAGGDGLPKWTQANESLVNEDVVLWYTMGVTHVPRPEEWPVMPVSRAGFRLVPDGFFSRNPALDVPAPKEPRKDGND